MAAWEEAGSPRRSRCGEGRVKVGSGGPKIAMRPPGRLPSFFDFPFQGGSLYSARLNLNRAVFLDRDGTLIQEMEYLSRPDAINDLAAAAAWILQTEAADKTVATR